MPKIGGEVVPRKPKRPCSYPGCPNLTDGCYCEKHQKVIDSKYNKERAFLMKKRYGKQWKMIRDRYIKLHPLCEQCQRNGRLTEAQEVHHIVPLTNGGTHEESNLMAICTSCHSTITAKKGGRWG
jgi:5-methylcytosine-specific restriction enzyme A